MKKMYGSKSAIRFLEFFNEMCNDINCGECEYYSLCHDVINCFNLDSAPDGWDDFIDELKEIYAV